MLRFRIMTVSRDGFVGRFCSAVSFDGFVFVLTVSLHGLVRDAAR